MTNETRDYVSDNLFEYFETFWLHNHGLSLSVSDVLRKTDNNSESFNRTFNGLTRVSHPRIFHLSEMITEQLEKTRLNVKHIHAGNQVATTGVWMSKAGETILEKHQLIQTYIREHSIGAINLPRLIHQLRNCNRYNAKWTIQHVKKHLYKLRTQRTKRRERLAKHRAAGGNDLLDNFLEDAQDAAAAEEEPLRDPYTENILRVNAEAAARNIIAPMSAGNGALPEDDLSSGPEDTEEEEAESSESEEEYANIQSGQSETIFRPVNTADSSAIIDSDEEVSQHVQSGRQELADSILGDDLGVQEDAARSDSSLEDGVLMHRPDPEHEPDEDEIDITTENLALNVVYDTKQSRYSCAHCDFFASTLNTVEGHVVENHMRDRGREYGCQTCNLQFDQEYHHRTHTELHEHGEFGCDYCLDIFPKSSTKIWHQQKTHSICPRCGEELTDQDGLMHHYNDLHFAGAAAEEDAEEEADAEEQDVEDAEGNYVQPRGRKGRGKGKGKGTKKNKETDKYMRRMDEEITGQPHNASAPFVRTSPAATAAKRKKTRAKRGPRAKRPRTYMSDEEGREMERPVGRTTRAGRTRKEGTEEEDGTTSSDASSTACTPVGHRLRTNTRGEV